MKGKLSFLVMALAIGVITPVVTSCGQNKTDYVSQCVLTDYIELTSAEGKNFLDNGIGKATVKKYIDGDTTHFYQEDSRVVKSRYIGVDTPESTGQIEKWGKAASNFTKSKLEAAKTIVLTSDINDIGKAAAVDSTGSRFKGLVWISEKENAPIGELKCLNLWLVQEGYSFGKGMKDSPLNQFFVDADLQAQNKKLNLYSPEDTVDPLFYVGPAVETSLEELSETYEEDGIETSWNGAKVAVTGVVCKTSGQYDCFIIDKNEETGKEYGLYVFAGYKTYSPMRTPGNKVRFVGTYTIYNGNPQLTNVAYNGSFFDAGEDDMKLISKNNPFEIREETVENITNRASINKVVTVKNLTIYSGYTETDKTTQKPSGAFTFRATDPNDKDISIRIPDDVWVINPETESRVTDWEELQGATVTLTACINYFASNEDDPYKGYYQLKLCNKDDITVTMPEED